jgi:hypothetical protein
VVQPNASRTLGAHKEGFKCRVCAGRRADLVVENFIRWLCMRRAVGLGRRVGECEQGAVLRLLGAVAAKNRPRLLRLEIGIRLLVCDGIVLKMDNEVFTRWLYSNRNCARLGRLTMLDGVTDHDNLDRAVRCIESRRFAVRAFRVQSRVIIWPGREQSA